MNIKYLSLIVAAVHCAGCSAPNDPGGEEAAVIAAAMLPATAASAPLDTGSPSDVAFWSGPDDGTVLLVAAGIEGLEILAADGTRLGLDRSVAAGFVTTVPDVVRGSDAPSLVVLYDAATPGISAYRPDAGDFRLREAMSSAVPVHDEVTGLCAHVSRLSGSTYLYVVTDGGLIHQYELYASDTDVAARLLRTIPSGKGSGFCSVDPRDGQLYVSEEATGVWRLGGEPESDTTRQPVDLREPFGGLGDDIKGIEILVVDGDASVLVVADAGNGRLAVYDLPGGDALATVEVAGVGEAEGLAASASPGGGMLAIADESADDGGPNVKLVSWDTIADATGLPRAAVAAPGDKPAVVRAVRETDVMPTFGDAADDPAIWVDVAAPERSLVIGTNKQSGLHVFDLDGRTLQVLVDGKMNNVDLRDGFPLGGEPVVLVTASNRTNDSIAAYRLDTTARRLIDVAAGVLETGFADPYGLCMYRSDASGEFFVFVNDADPGIYRQWRLYDDGRGRVVAEQVREFEVGSQAEGCAADDVTGRLYVAEEDVGLWRYSAEPDGGDERVLIDDTTDGRLTDDVEGVTIWSRADGSGYLVVSNQGKDNYAVYRQGGDNAYVGHFHIVANPAAGIDGASETDGLDVTSVALGPGFPDGLLVVQDGRNIAPEEPQNFKFVSWRDVADALGLD